MAFTRINSLWKVMSNNILKFEENKDLTCLLCKNIMKDPCSSLCGCHYCYVCIIEFLGDQTKYCPGDYKECKDEYLEYDKNLRRDIMLTKLISKLRVYCPNESCLYNSELIEMDDHLRVCTKQTIECPFFTIGCTNKEVNKSTINGHLHDDTFMHSELMINIIQNMKNDVSGMKHEIASLKEESDIKQKRIAEDLLREVDIRITRERNERNKEEEYLKRKIEEESIKEEKVTTSMTDEIATLREESKRKEEEVYELKSQIKEVKVYAEKITTRMTDEIVFMKEESEIKEKRIMTLEELLKKLEIRINEERNEEKNEVNCLKSQLEELRINVETFTTKMRNDIEETKLKRDNWEGETEAKLDRWIKLCPNIGADFVWLIAELSKKKDLDVYSDTFYHNNYNLCMRMYINSYNDNIGLWCYIMMGDYDDDLQWLLSRSITISIIDQYTLRTHKSETYQSYFNRPTNERKRGSWFSFFSSNKIKDKYDGNGSPSFIKYSSIKEKASITYNDSIIVSIVLSLL